MTGSFSRLLLHAPAFQLKSEIQETLLTMASGYPANKSPNGPVSTVAVFSVSSLPVKPL